MKSRFAIVPMLAVAGLGAYVAFDPGVAYADPRPMGAPTPIAAEASYTLDAAHSSIYFDITHLGLSQVHGRFNKFTAKIKEDSADLTKASVEFTAQIDSVDTGIAARDAHLKRADFFDAEKFPTMTFKSTKVEKSGDKYIVTGDLTMKDKTKSVSIPFKHYGPEGGRIGIVADTIQIKRSDFGVGSTAPGPTGRPGASDEVNVRISFEAIQDRS